jgi:hypothetical protein
MGDVITLVSPPEAQPANSPGIPEEGISAMLDEEIKLNRFLSLAQYPITYERVPVGTCPTFVQAACRVAKAFKNNPCTATLLDWLALRKIGLAHGIRRRNTIQRLLAYPPRERPSADTTSRTARHPAQKATRLVESGRISVAAERLGDSLTYASWAEKLREDPAEDCFEEVMGRQEGSSLRAAAQKHLEKVPVVNAESLEKLWELREVGDLRYNLALVMAGEERVEFLQSL